MRKIHIRFNGDIISILMMMFVFVLGFINIIIFPHNMLIGTVNYSETLFFIIITLVKVATAIFIIFEFASMSEEQMHSLIKKIIISVTWLIIIVSIYTLFNPKEIYSGVSIARTTIEDTNPNELAVFLTSFLIYPVYLFFKGNKKMKMISAISVILGSAIVGLTLSRGGMITYIVTIILILYSMYRVAEVKKQRMIILAIVLIMFIIANKYASNIILDRFIRGYEQQGMVGLTSHRNEVWLNGLEMTIKHRFFFGFGTSLKATQFINLIKSQGSLVMHSIVIGVFVQFGITGLIVFIYMLYRAVKGYFQYYIKHLYYVLPIITLIALIIGGLSNELEYRELFWITIGMSFGVMAFIRRNESKLTTQNEDNAKTKNNEVE